MIGISESAAMAEPLLFLPNDCDDPMKLDLLSTVEREALVKIRDWVADFPTRKVVKFGRTEAICPFVEPAIQRETMHFALAQLAAPNNIGAIDGELRRFARIFNELEPMEMPAAMTKTVVAIFPETTGQLLLDATDASRDLKGDMLESGILVGEFFPTCPFASTFDPKLFALRSPVPMYVLRSFIETDWRFIAQVERWRGIYRERFGEPPRDLQHLGTLRGRVLAKLGKLRKRFG
tara:strand:+ start:6231 stop:6935 length:705 start_codon:yes stop_codon:yes gene_type:complete